RQSVEGAVDQFRRRATLTQFAGQLGAPMFAARQQIHGNPAHSDRRIQNSGHGSIDHRSLATSALALGFASASALAPEPALTDTGTASSFSRMPLSSASRTSRLSSRYLAAFALPWPILLPW